MERTYTVEYTKLYFGINFALFKHSVKLYNRDDLIKFVAHCVKSGKVRIKRIYEGEIIIMNYEIDDKNSFRRFYRDLKKLK